jgi:hypothetical protein
MRNRKLIIIGSLLIALVVLVVAFALPRRAFVLPLTVSFLNYTNDTNGIRLAMFALTNRSDVTIRRWGFYRPESQQPGLHPALHLGPNVYLAPGQSEFISIFRPTDRTVWRAVFHCSREGWRSRFSDWMGQSSGGLIHAVVPARWQGVPLQSVQSDWIEP